MPKFIDLTGRRFGAWIVIRELPIRIDRQIYWECKCDCGAIVSVIGQNLRKGGSESCGCVGAKIRAEKNTKHGLINSKSYRIWAGMLQRCNNPKCNIYEYYGGRGIEVCERWHIFENFYEDMGERPKGMSLDRKDSNGHYNKDNCKWSTYKEQSRNTRTNRFLTFHGKTQTMIAWSEELGIGYQAIRSRLRKGMSDDEVLGTPYNPRMKEKIFQS